MPSQLDAIVPRDVATRVVPVGDGAVTVRGLSARDVMMLRRRHPIFRDPAVFAQPADDALPDELAEQIVAAFPVIIAAGLGEAGRDYSEALAERLSIDDQTALYLAIMELSNPAGRRPLPNGGGKSPTHRKRTATPPPSSGN